MIAFLWTNSRLFRKQSWKCRRFKSLTLSCFPRSSRKLESASPADFGTLSWWRLISWCIWNLLRITSCSPRVSFIRRSSAMPDISWLCHQEPAHKTTWILDLCKPLFQNSDSKMTLSWINLSWSLGLSRLFLRTFSQPLGLSMMAISDMTNKPKCLGLHHLKIPQNLDAYGTP